MHITKLKAKNFRSFDNLDLDLPEKGITLLTGTNERQPSLVANGVGKTTIFDAICWALYKKTAKGHDAVRLNNRWTGITGYSVELELLKADGTTHTIERVWKPSGSNILRLDGSDVDQEEIEGLLCLNYEQFLLATYAKQRGDHFVDLTPGKKLNFLAEVFNLDVWTRRANWCKDKVKDLESELAGLRQVVEQLKKHHEQTAARKVDLEAKSNAWTVEQEEQQKTFSKEIDHLNECSIEWEKDQAAKIAEAEALIKELEASLEEPVSDADTEARFKELKQQIDQLGLDHLRQLHLEAAQNASRLTAELNHLEKQAVTMMEQKDAPTCKTCGQAINTEQHDHQCLEILDRVAALQQETAAAEQAQTEALENVNQAQHTYEDLCRQRDAITAQVNALADKRVLRSGIEAQIRSQRHAIENPPINPYTGQVELLSKRKAEQPANPYTAEIAEAETDLSKLEGTLEVRQAEVSVIEQQIQKYLFWKSTFPEYRLEVLDEIVAKLEVYFSHAFSNLGLDNWRIQISTSRELKSGDTTRELHMTIFDDTEEADIDTLSGGEMQRLRIASAIGMSDLVKAQLEAPLNLLILDEPTLGMNVEGIHGLQNYLKQVAEHTHILLAEHRVTEDTLCDRIISITKNPQGISSIEQPALEPVAV